MTCPKCEKVIKLVDANVNCNVLAVINKAGIITAFRKLIQVNKVNWARCPYCGEDMSLFINEE